MSWRRSATKYGSSRASYDGVIYHSQLERNDAMWLDMYVKDRRITDLQRQVRYRIFVEATHICDAIVDFKYTVNEGPNKGLIVWHETKGFPTEVWKLKKKLIEATIQKGEVYLVNPTERQLFHSPCG